jgi:hypothetical protein
MLVLPTLQSLGWELKFIYNNYFYFPPDKHRARIRSPEEVIQGLKSDEKRKDNEELHAGLNSHEKALRAVDGMQPIDDKDNHKKVGIQSNVDSSRNTGLNYDVRKPPRLFLPSGDYWWENRRDYFDSKPQVLRFLRKRTNMTDP